jgi:glycosyltransferase involved in cell wall biosynthesis
MGRKITKMTQKIIVIGTYNPNKPDFHPKPDEESYYVASWGALWARRIKARYPGLDIEVWRPEPDFTRISQRTAFGVDCTIFPAKRFLVSKTVTLQMLWQLYKRRSSHDLVIHINTIFAWQFNLMMPILLPRAKFVLSHHGGVFPTEEGFKYWLKNKILNWSYRKIDTVTYLRKNIKQRIQQANDSIRFSFLPVGADFKHFRPLNKQATRKKLNLPHNKVLGVYVGRFYRLKGVDRILDVYRHFKENDFSVMFVGGSPADELYQEVVQSGCPFWHHVNHDLLREILSAADFYIHPAFHPEFGGFDVSLIEALACNRPVLSPHLNELDFDHSQLGLAIDDENEILEKSDAMISEFQKFTQCRETAMPHLDGTTAIVDKLYKIFLEK